MQFQLASPEHEPQLRALLREDAMPGWIRLRSEREPDFFHAAATQGPVHQTIVAVDGSTVIGAGSRAVRELFVNGAPEPVGYLGGLRSRPLARRRTGLARGYAFLRQLHDDRLTRGYLTTILDGNSAVQDLLTSGRAGLPRYHDLGMFYTHAFATRCGGSPRRTSHGIGVAPATTGDWPEIARFLREAGARRQFFPVVSDDDLGTPLWRDLGCGDFLIARDRSGHLAGCVACWDQSRFKQTRVIGYAPWLQVIRAPINPGLRALGLPQLPQSGACLNIRTLSLLCIRDAAGGVLDTLLDHACSHAAEAGADVLIVGLHEHDPLSAGLRKRRALRYACRVYWVSWDDGYGMVNNLDRRRPLHLEAALL